MAQSLHDIALGVAFSAAAPAMATVVTNPFDVAKTRLNMDRELQAASAPSRYNGVADCLRKIYRRDGVAGLQRGLGFVVVRESSKNAFRIGLFEPTVSLLGGLHSRARRRSSPSAAASSTPPMSVRVAAGVFTGALSALLCNPLDLLKTRLQLDAGKSAAGALRELVKAEGAAALWRRGVLANMGRSAAATGVGLPVNARLKEIAASTPALAGDGLIACRLRAGCVRIAC